MAYKQRKRKIKKNIPEGIAHIHATFNNTITTITDKDGNAISWASSGAIGFKGSKNLLHLPQDKQLKKQEKWHMMQE